MSTLEKWQGRWVEIIYEDRCGALSQRTVYVQQADHRHLVGFCAKRQAPRRFVADRILSLAPVVRHAG